MKMGAEERGRAPGVFRRQVNSTHQVLRRTHHYLPSALMHQTEQPVSSQAPVDLSMLLGAGTVVPENSCAGNNRQVIHTRRPSSWASQAKYLAQGRSNSLYSLEKRFIEQNRHGFYADVSICCFPSRRRAWLLVLWSQSNSLLYLSPVGPRQKFPSSSTPVRGDTLHSTS